MPSYTNRKDTTGIAWVAQVRLKGFKATSKPFDTQANAKVWAEAVEKELATHGGAGISRLMRGRQPGTVNRYQAFGSGSICMAHRLRPLAFLTLVSAVALLTPVNRARAAEPASQGAAISVPSDETPSTLETVIVQARKDQEIKRQITKFVSGGIVTYLNESLERWNRPICPLVTGLPSKQAEFIRARVSQVAKDSHAPLGAEHCRPNFLVVASNDPDPLFENWGKRFPGLFDTCNGLGSVKRFLRSREPVRVFYNTQKMDCANVRPLGTSMHHGGVQEMTSVVIVVDGRQITKISLGQLADYVAMIGLAQIRMKADTGTATSILQLFQGSDPPPLGLSAWDAAFLNSLYTAEQSSVFEVSMIEDRMFDQIVGR